MKKLALFGSLFLAIFVVGCRGYEVPGQLSGQGKKEIKTSQKEAQAQFIKKENEVKSKESLAANQSAADDQKSSSAVASAATGSASVDSGSQYIGSQLVTVKSNAFFAHFEVRGNDAKALFMALKVKEVIKPGNKTYLPSRVRTGEKYVCYQQARISNPEASEFSCSVFLNYRTGEVLSNKTDGLDPELSADRKAQALIGLGYDGNQVKLKVTPEGAIARVNMKGRDAQKLYELLQLIPQVSEVHSHQKNKSAPQMVCMELVENAEKHYRCDFKFKSENGASF